MGKAALLAISGFIVVGAVYSFGTSQSTLATEKRVADFQYETLAKNAAQVGHNRAEKILAQQVHGGSYGPVGINATYDGMPYTVEATWTGDEVSVKSTATARKGEDDELTYWMRSRYKKETVATSAIADQAPKFMQYAILADSTIELDGNVSAETDKAFTAEGDGDNPLNANIHSNTGIDVDGNAASVRGNGTTDGDVNAKEGIFDPYDCSDCDGVSEETPDVTIGDEGNVFDAAAHVDTLGGADKTSSGSNGIVQVTGNDDLPTLNDNNREDPFIWHVKGRLEITGDVTIPGYVLIVVEDGFKIAGNVTIGEVNYDASVESNFGIYAEGTGTIDQSGNSELNGQIFAEGDMDIDVGGNADIYGSITTRGAVTLHGTPTLHYRPASPALTDAWDEVTTQVKLIQHHEGKNAP